MGKPTPEKQMKAIRRRNRIVKHFRKHPKCVKFIRNQKAENHRKTHYDKIKKMIEERQEQLKNRKWYQKLRDTIQNWYLRNVYAKYRKVQADIQKFKNFIKGQS